MAKAGPIGSAVERFVVKKGRKNTTNKPGRVRSAQRKPSRGQGKP